jgi:hypothetical protein
VLVAVGDRLIRGAKSEMGDRRISGERLINGDRLISGDRRISGAFDTSTSRARIRSYGMSARAIDVAPGPVVGVAGLRLAEIGDGFTVTVTVPSSAPPKPSTMV